MTPPPPLLPPIVTVVGRKHSGKTTLVVRLAAELHRRGHRVMTIKHGAHTFNIDPQTTDTYRHYHEGNAERVVMVAPDKFALVQRWSEELGPREIADRYLRDADIVLCEGFKSSDLPRIEVFRRAAHNTSLYAADAPNAQHYLAVVTDDVAFNARVPVFDISAAELLPRLAELVEQRVMRGAESGGAPVRRWSALLIALGAAGCASGAGRSPAALSPRQQLTRFVDSSVTDARFRSAHWGVLIVDAERGDTLYSRNAGKVFMPASNQKLLTGAVALDVLGPAYRYATHFAAAGPIVDGVLQGDLIVRGTGDPSISDAMQRDAMSPLRAVAESLYTRGVRRINGRLTSAGDPFPAPAYGYGWAWDDLDFPYSAGVDELMFNEGFARVRIRAGSDVDAPVSVSVAPAREYPQVRVLARTAARGDSAARFGRALRVRHDSAALGFVIVEGAIAAGDSTERRIAFRDQRHAYLSALREALVDRGITVDSSGIGWIAGATNGHPEATGLPLFSWRSDSLGIILAAFEKPSQNQIGELLLRTIGLTAGSTGTPEEGARIVSDALRAWGAAPDGFRVRDGSGLSRHNVVSPETIIRVLDAMRRSPHFTVFRDALPIAGVDGTIGNRMRGTLAANNVHAKTGTLDMVRSLSGYVTSADGRLLMFSILCNNWLVEVRDVDRVADGISVRLAELRLTGQ